MYVPPKFKADDLPAQLALMRAHPFATVITAGEGGSPEINHFPLLVDEREGTVALLGHLARANPQWKAMETGDVTAIFHGPHTYVTPTWYRDPDNVPTWNYAVVHATGRARLIHDFEGIESILSRTVAEFERHEPRPWSYALDEPFRRGLVRAIVGFEIEVTRLEGKFKLSQNRAPRDRAGVMEGLARRTDEGSRRVLELMQALDPG